MIKTILLNRKLPFPHISFSLLLSCLIISLPTIFNDVLYAFLGANVGLAFPWQYLTSVFSHGPEPPLMLHLIINLLIIVFCMALVEKLLGTWRTFLIIVFISAILIVIRFETLNFYNGISSFIFTFTPFAFFILIMEFKNGRKLFWKEILNNMLFLTIVVVFIFYPIYFSLIETFFCERNILHFISLMIGLILFLIWKNRFTELIAAIARKNLQKIKTNIADKTGRILAYMITFINFLILLVVLIFFD